MSHDHDAFSGRMRALRMLQLHAHALDHTMAKHHGAGQHARVVTAGSHAHGARRAPAPHAQPRCAPSGMTRSSATESQSSAVESHPA